LSRPDSNPMRVQRLVVGGSQTNCYLLVCTQTLKSVILDPGAEAGRILQHAAPTTPQCILITHGHSDHTGALEELQWKLNLPIGIHPDDASSIPFVPEIELTNGSAVRFGEVTLQVLHVPGHTPGSVALLSGDRLLSGDTVFPGGPGRTRSPESFRQIVASIRERILPLPGATKVLPGHGASTTISQVQQEYEVFSHRHGIGELFGDVLWAG
jgi:hydroxyacylglutathione hydrolase